MTVVVAASQAHVAWLTPATALHVIVAVVPSWSWTEMVPLVTPFIFSLKVTVNESPKSAKSVLPRLLAIRASIIVGGVKSAAPVVKVIEELVGRQTLKTFLISPHAPVNVRV